MSLACLPHFPACSSHFHVVTAPLAHVPRSTKLPLSFRVESGSFSFSSAPLNISRLCHCRGRSPRCPKRILQIALFENSNRNITKACLLQRLVHGGETAESEGRSETSFSFLFSPLLFFPLFRCRLSHNSSVDDDSYEDALWLPAALLALPAYLLALAFAAFLLLLLLCRELAMMLATFRAQPAANIRSAAL